MTGVSFLFCLVVGVVEFLVFDFEDIVNREIVYSLVKVMLSGFYKYVYNFNIECRYRIYRLIL